VPGSDEIEPVADTIDEGTEFDHPVAHHIGARGVSDCELIQGVGNHRVEVLLLQRHNLERHAGNAAHLAHDREVLLPGATSEERHLVLEPDLEVESGELVPTLLSKPHQRHRGVDTTGHQDSDTTHRCRILVELGIRNEELGMPPAFPENGGGWKGIKN